MKNGNVKGLCIALGLMLGVQTASAVVTPYASRVAFDAANPNSIYETWDTYPAGQVIANGSALKGITYNSSAPNAVVTNTFLASTNPNTLGRTPVNFFNVGDSMTFTFATGVSAFGIDINTFATLAGAYTATTNLGDVINSVFDPFPATTTGQFVGFSSTTPFTAVTIAAPGGFSYNLDTMRIVSMPEPATALFGVLGAGVLALRRRRAA
jgi:MYXO-CTERM domain-containing protein